MTHEFIDFKFDATKLSHRDWMLLGEACSKISHVIGVPLEPSVAKAMLQISLVKGARATTAIEGNTLSEEQVDQIVRGELELPRSQAYLQREVENIVKACNGVIQETRTGAWQGVTEEWLLTTNAQILANLEHAEDVVPGAWRAHTVGVAKYLAPPPGRVAELMRRFVTFLQDMDKAVHNDELMRRPMRLIRAILSHLYVAWIHPFGDGNGRTARLTEVALLLEAGVPVVSGHILSNHYNMTRSEYYRQLDRASATGSVYGFITYSLQGLVDGLSQEVALIQQQQIRVTWRNYVYETLDPNTTAGKRRALVAIELGQAKHAEGVPAASLPRLSIRLAEEYAGSTSKTVTRDVNALRDAGLLVRRGRRWVANLDIVRAFRPYTVGWG